MALGVLDILFVIMVIVSGLGIGFLYYSKEGKARNATFYFLTIWSIVVAYINLTSLPSNYLTERIIACVFGLIALLAIIIKTLKQNKKNIAYILVSLSTLLSLVDLFFF